MGVLLAIAAVALSAGVLLVLVSVVTRSAAALGCRVLLVLVVLLAGGLGSRASVTSAWRGTRLVRAGTVTIVTFVTTCRGFEGTLNALRVAAVLPPRRLACALAAVLVPGSPRKLRELTGR